MICYAFPLPIEQPGCRIFIFSPKAGIVCASFAGAIILSGGTRLCKVIFGNMR